MKSSTQGARSSKTARYQSPPIRYTDYQDNCLEFYYYLHGVHPATLNVYLKQNDKLGLPVWTKTFSQQKGWVRGELKITGVQYDTFQVSFEGVNPRAVFGVRKKLITFFRL